MDSRGDRPCDRGSRRFNFEPDCTTTEIICDIVEEGAALATKVEKILLATGFNAHATEGGTEDGSRMRQDTTWSHGLHLGMRVEFAQAVRTDVPKIVAVAPAPAIGDMLLDNTANDTGKMPVAIMGHDTSSKRGGGFG